MRAHVESVKGMHVSSTGVSGHGTVINVVCEEVC